MDETIADEAVEVDDEIWVEKGLELHGLTVEDGQMISSEERLLPWLLGKDKDKSDSEDDKEEADGWFDFPVDWCEFVRELLWFPWKDQVVRSELKGESSDDGLRGAVPWARHTDDNKGDTTVEEADDDEFE